MEHGYYCTHVLDLADDVSVAAKLTVVLCGGPPEGSEQLLLIGLLAERTANACSVYAPANHSVASCTAFRRETGP